MFFFNEFSLVKLGNHVLFGFGDMHHRTKKLSPSKYTMLGLEELYCVKKCSITRLVQIQ